VYVTSVVSFDYGRTVPARFLFSDPIGLHVLLNSATSYRQRDFSQRLLVNQTMTGNYNYNDQPTCQNRWAKQGYLVTARSTINV